MALERTEPTGFDYYKVLPGQGRYFDPVFKTAENWEYGWKGGKEQKGFSSDIIGTESLDWIDAQDPEKPFFLMTHFKATHEPFHYPERHAELLEDVVLPEPNLCWSLIQKKAREHSKDNYWKTLPKDGCGIKQILINFGLIILECLLM